MLKRLTLSLVAAFAVLCCPAQETETQLINLQTEVRLDYQHDSRDGSTVDSNTGFEGKYINFKLSGQILPGLTYSWRQRLNKIHKDGNFFDATDWVYLQYEQNRWSVSVGKEVVAIGGWEYDRSPIDLYSCSVFWNNIPCYQLGVAGGYKVTDRDKLTAQIVQSPFHSSDNRNMYGFNLMWNGSHGPFTAIYSANLLEYGPNRYISYIALGNRFDFGKLRVEVDLMNRAAAHQKFLLRDCSVMGEISYRPTGRWRVFGKMTYDVNHSGTAADATVLAGTEMKMAGGGLEFYPLITKRHALRLHANCFYAWGRNANSADVMQDKSLMVDVGVKWTMDLFSWSPKK